MQDEEDTISLRGEGNHGGMGLQGPSDRRCQLHFEAEVLRPMRVLRDLNQVEQFFLPDHFQEWPTLHLLPTEAEDRTSGVIHEDDTSPLIDGDDPLDHALE